MAKDDIDWIDIEVFPGEVNKGKDSHPPDINPDNPGKGRISLLKRSPSIHSESDAEEVKDEDITSARSRSSEYCKGTDTDYKPDLSLEGQEILTVEQVIGPQGYIRDRVKSKVGTQDVSTGDIVQ